MLVIIIAFSLLQNIKLDQNNLASKLDGFLKAHVNNRQFSGTVLVAKNGKIILKKGYGFANDSLKNLATVSTKYRIASLTKSFTAMILFLMEKQKKLSMADRLSKYIPDYPNGDSILLDQILHHTSGIPDLLQYEAYWHRLDRYVSAEEAVSIFKNKELQFKPGSGWGYSNSGYILLGLLIEKVTGKKYIEVLNELIFEPLLMTNSGFESDQLIDELGASGYQIQDGERVRLPYVQMSINHAAGALYSTVDDLYKWDRALYPDKLLSKDELERLFTPELNAYGWGWGIIQQQRFKKKQIFMNGRFSGFAANISRYPDDDMCVIVLSNVMSIDPQAIANNLISDCFW